MKRAAVRVTGRVQGVFFRDSTRSEARRLGLTGWVSNDPDGSVVVEAQGSAEQVDELVVWLHTGPRQAQVVRVIADDIDPLDHETGFNVR